MKFDTKKKVILGVTIALTMVVMIMIGTILASVFHKEEEPEPEVQIAEVVEEEPQEEEPEEEAEEEPEEEPLTNDLDFSALRSAVTEDATSWLYVPGTVVNYPVLRAGSGKDTDYYLRKDYKGTYFTGGCVYMQQRNRADYGSKDTVIYGHNMNNGTMFHSLHNYEDGSFFKSHPYIIVFTPEKTLIYQVFCAYRDDDKLILAYYNDFADNSTFMKYIDGVRNSTNGKAYQTNKDVKVEASDRIISLSTCIRYDEVGRFLLLGKLLSSEEAAKVDKSLIEEAYNASAEALNKLVKQYQ